MYKKIHIRMLYYLSENQETVTSVSLAKFIERSARTVKNEMQELRRISPDFGIEIITRRGKGYQAKIVDEELYISMYEKYLNSVNFSEHTNNLKLERTDYIISLLLSANSIITLDDIEEKMYLSKNSFKEELNEAIKFIESYGIKVSQQTGIGIKLLGLEESYRLAYTEMIGMYFNSYETLERSISLQVFQFDYHQRQEIRNKFLSVLRMSDISISDEAIQRISIYLLVSINRIAQGFILNDLDNSKELKTTQAYILSKHIIDGVQSVVEVEFSENEVIQVARLILINSYEYQQFNENYYTSYEIAAKKMLSEIVEENQSSLFYLEMSDLNRLVPVITKILISIDYNNESIMFSPIRKKYSPYCHISYLIASRIKGHIEDKLHVHLSDRFDGELEKVIMITIDSMDLSHEKATVAVVSSSGKEYAKYLASKVQNKFTNLVSAVEYHELYELRDRTTQDIQLLISDVDETMYRYTFPHYSMSGYEMTLDEYRSIAIILVKLMFKIFDDFLEVEIEFHDVLKVESTKELIKMFSFLYGSSDYPYALIQKQLEVYIKESKMDVDSDVVMILLDEKYASEPFVHIYQYPSTDGQKYILAVHIGEHSKLKLKYLTVLTRVVMSNYEAVELWKKTRDFNMIFDLIAEQILLENQVKSII